MSVGSAVSVTLQSHGVYYFEVDAESGNNLLITLEPGPQQMVNQNATRDNKEGSDIRFANLTENIDGISSRSVPVDPTAVRAVIRRGKLPSAYEYDQSVQTPVSALSAELPVAPTVTDKYYVLLFAPFLSSGEIKATLRAEYVGFHISSVSPDTGGSGGSVTVQLRGTEFTRDTVARLVATDRSTITGETRLFVNQSEMFVTFNLGQATRAYYDVQIEQGGRTETLVDAFEVVPPVPGHVQVDLKAPRAVRPARQGTLIVEYSNPGNTDVPTPLLKVVANGAELRLPEQVDFIGGSIQLYATSTGGPSDVLVPGTRDRITLVFRPTTAQQEATFSVSKLERSTYTPSTRMQMSSTRSNIEKDRNLNLTNEEIAQSPLIDNTALMAMEMFFLKDIEAF